MTKPARTPAQRFEEVEEVYALLREHGHRVTTPCRIVVESLFDAAEPVSAQRIADDSVIAGFELSSVYRNLERLEELGIARHVHLGHGPSLYMLVGEGEREYLLCERCGRARSVEPAELDPVRESIESRFGYAADFRHFPIVGLCGECRDTGEDPSSRS